jgi:hypothetical protein
VFLMSKGNGFFSNLKKSTKITLVSCGCFIAMTALILFFFVMFPITPSEKIISSIGRESISKKDQSDSLSTTTTGLTTVNTTSVTTKTRTTTVKGTKSDYVITITSGSGFYTGQKIPSGGYPNEYYSPTTSTIADSDYTGGGSAGGYTGGGNSGGYTGGGYTGGGYTGGDTTSGGYTGGGTTGGDITSGGGTDTPAPVDTGSGTDTPAPVDSGNDGGGEAPAPVDGGGSAE